MAEGQPYDPNAPENKYPKMKHKLVSANVETGEYQFEEKIVKDPTEEKLRTPASKGWVDLKRDVIEKLEADAVKADAKASA